MNRGRKAKIAIEVVIPIVAAVVDALLVFCELFDFLSANNKVKGAFYISAAILTIVAFLLHLFQRKKYVATLHSELMSKEMLNALERANEEKSNYILQTTYGNIPEWRPIDYTRNFLPYDVHAQIRHILFCLRDAILVCNQDLTKDDINVDLVTAYDYSIQFDDGIDTGANWRIITTGNHDMGGSLQGYLKNEHSFYTYILKHGYKFCNNKASIEYDENDEKKRNGYYIPSVRDKQNNCRGSIIGIPIELRNDAPEKVFVKGILTITTYGKELYKQSFADISEAEFEFILRENILYSTRSLLVSEFAQMYIRHVLRDGKMCPRTGYMLVDSHIGDKDNAEFGARCAWGGHHCHFNNAHCHN